MAEDQSIFFVGSVLIFLCLVSLALRLYEHQQYKRISEKNKEKEANKLD